MNDYSYVKGFNYFPSYAFCNYDIWRLFDAEVFDREIGLGKKYFPKMNTIRLWLSYDAFRYEEDKQAENFETALKICDKYGCKVIVCLFNHWHDGDQDHGGIYHPQMIPGSIWSASEHLFDSYIEKMVKPHKDDERILIWDVCNEPYSYGNNQTYIDFIEPYETAWLKKICDMCHAAGVIQPVGISNFELGTYEERMERHEKLADFVDVFLIHPYYYQSDYDVTGATALNPDGFAELLNEYKQLSKKYNKPILTTETCWGSRDDKIRAEIVKLSLKAHNDVGIGFVAHALHWSHCADLHNDSDGPLGRAGNLAFITRDDKLREGHEVFNEA